MKLSRILLLLFCVISLQAMELVQNTGQSFSSASGATVSLVGDNEEWKKQLLTLARRMNINFKGANVLARRFQQQFIMSKEQVLNVITDSNANEWPLYFVVHGKESWHANIGDYNTQWLKEALNMYVQRFPNVDTSNEVRLVYEEVKNPILVRWMVERANAKNQTLEMVRKDYFLAKAKNIPSSLGSSAPTTTTTTFEGSQSGSTSSSDEAASTVVSSGGSNMSSYKSDIPVEIMRSMNVQIERVSALWGVVENDLVECYMNHISASSGDPKVTTSTLIETFTDQMELLYAAIPEDKIKSIKNECGIDSAQKLFRFFYIASDNPKNSSEENVKLYLKKYPRSVPSTVTSSGSSCSTPTSSTSSSTSSESSTSSAGNGQPVEKQPDLSTESKVTDTPVSVDNNALSTGSKPPFSPSKTTHWQKYKYGYFIVGGAVAVSALVAVGAYWYFDKKKEDKKS